MLKKLLVLIIILYSSIVTSQTEGCFSKGPTYYTTKVLSIYESMSTNSAITLDIPREEAVTITNSFFGDHGWWEICYKGNRGWVKKTYLTRTAPKIVHREKVEEEEEISDSTSTSIDIGFDPFYGKTKSVSNFRTAPSITDSHIIKKLPVGSQLYIFSTETVNKFYKAIDINSAKVGWISKDLITKTGKVDVSSEGAFQSTGTTEDYNSSVEIKNKSLSNITLIVGGETFYLDPKSTETKSISPGRKYYIATAPGVLPASGYQVFDQYHGYKWEFWIETTRY